MTPYDFNSDASFKRQHINNEKCFKCSLVSFKVSKCNLFIVLRHVQQPGSYCDR